MAGRLPVELRGAERRFPANGVGDSLDQLRRQPAGVRQFRRARAIALFEQDFGHQVIQPGGFDRLKDGRPG